MSSPSPALQHVSTPRPDQRSHLRFPIVLDLQYKFMDGVQAQHAGLGRTLNISQGGLLFELTNDPLDTTIPERDRAIELTIGWQFLLQEICTLKLIVRGRIVRAEPKRLAIKLDQQEFHAA